MNAITAAQATMVQSDWCQAASTEQELTFSRADASRPRGPAPDRDVVQNPAFLGYTRRAETTAL